jgi:uncharacterized protein
VEVEWNEAKAASNFRKHGVTFDEAATVLLDPLAVTFADDHAAEARSITVGHSALARLLVVVTTERHGDRIRIISARRATAKERREYEEAI